MPEEKELEKCVVSDQKFNRHGCFYSIKGINERLCACICIKDLINKINSLEIENKELHDKLDKIKSEI